MMLQVGKHFNSRKIYNGTVSSDADVRKSALKEFLRNCVRECRPLLNPTIPLGTPEPQSRPDRGPSAQAYYKKKHADGNFGTYYLHHTVVYSGFRFR
jgi:hypothetical protein